MTTGEVKEISTNYGTVELELFHISLREQVELSIGSWGPKKSGHAGLANNRVSPGSPMGLRTSALYFEIRRSLRCRRSRRFTWLSKVYSVGRAMTGKNHLS